MVDSSSENVVLSPNVLGPWAESIGLEFTHVAPDEVQATWRVTAALTQPYGLLHGGVHCSVVETLSSLGASIWLGERGKVVGVSNSTSFFRPCVVGDLLSSISLDRSSRVQTDRFGRSTPAASGEDWLRRVRCGCTTCSTKNLY